ncbi:hypothetical protein Tco_0563009, partial [Tanacetum coccineum]
MIFGILCICSKESDDDLPICFKRNKNKNVPSITRIPTNRVIDDSTDEDVAEYKYLDEDYENLLDDQGNDDVQVDE